jgi:hypothetical protein
MLFAIAGVATAFNLAIVHYKFSHDRYLDGVLDIGAFIFLVWLFKDSGQGGIVIGMIASFCVSLYLLVMHRPKPKPLTEEEQAAANAARQAAIDAKVTAIRERWAKDNERIRNNTYTMVGIIALLWIVVLVLDSFGIRIKL